MENNVKVSFNRDSISESDWTLICHSLQSKGITITTGTNDSTSESAMSSSRFIELLLQASPPPLALSVPDGYTTVPPEVVSPLPHIFTKLSLSFPSPIIFNHSAVINIAGNHIPDELLLVASLGEKFVPPIPLDKNRIYLDLAKIQHRQQLDSSLFEQATKLVQDFNEKPFSSTQKHIKHIFDIAKTFLKDNPNINVSSADKGNISVIYDRNFYIHKMIEHLSNVSVYQSLSSTSHLGLIKRNFTLLSRLAQDGFLGRGRIQFIVAKETQYPLIYGQWKVHKNFGLRPIMACNNVIGNKLFDVIVDVLNKMDKDNSYSIKNSISLVQDIKLLKLKPDDRLFSIDVVSMFTNIQPELALSIILPRIHQFTTLSLDLFRDIFIFVTKFATEFQFEGKTFKQISGLPMGAIGSPVIASLVLTFILDHVLPNHEQVTFLKKFVDDTILITSKQNAQAILHSLNDFDSRIKFTMEEENENGHINFLDVTLIRHPDHTIGTKWFCKPFSSNRLVNWYSEHEPHTIRNTTTRMISNMISYSDISFHDEIRKFAELTLYKNSFPSERIGEFITKSMEIVAFNIIGENDAENTQFLSTLAPHPLLKAINACSRSNDSNVKYVNSFHSHNAGSYIFSQLKSPLELELLTDVVVRITCKQCKFFRIVPIITPLILYQALKLSKLFHPFNSILEHNNSSKHEGFKTKIEKNCKSTPETLRYTEQLCKRLNIPVPGNARDHINNNLLSRMM